MIDPAAAHIYGGGLLASGGIPQFDRAILSARGDEVLRRMKSENIDAIFVGG